jgi:hypothetical protein
MSDIEIQAAIGLIIVFATGIFIGIIVIASCAYRREDRRGSITDPAPDALCQGARILTGVGTIGGPGWLIPEPRASSEDGQRTEARL